MREEYVRKEYSRNMQNELTANGKSVPSLSRTFLWLGRLVGSRSLTKWLILACWEPTHGYPSWHNRSTHMRNGIEYSNTLYLLMHSLSVALQTNFTITQTFKKKCFADLCAHIIRICFVRKKICSSADIQILSIHIYG